MPMIATRSGRSAIHPSSSLLKEKQIPCLVSARVLSFSLHGFALPQGFPLITPALFPLVGKREAQVVTWLPRALKGRGERMGCACVLRGPAPRLRLSPAPLFQSPPRGCARPYWLWERK